jgi:uncharacterized heparinase superfamily protein
MGLQRIRLYLSTLSNLRPIQLMYLPVRRFQQRLETWLPGLSSWQYRRTDAPDKVSPASLTALASRVVPILSASESPLVAKGKVRVLNREVELSKVEWERDIRPALWAYHLHYFDGALALALATARGDRDAADTLSEWLRTWIERCRPGRGPGWHPFPISQRLVNWIWVDLIAGQALPPALVSTMRSSALQQAAYLADHLEFHLLANHLLKNVKALYLAALIWGQDRRAHRWYRRAAAVLKQAIREQVMLDGGHCERSMMYHDAVLQDLLELALVAQAAGVPQPISLDVLRKMATFRMTLMHSDGSRARFNDIVEGLVSTSHQIGSLYELFDPEWQWAEPSRVELSASGYYGYRDGRNGERFFIDAGEPGPRYQPAHAHCGLLSFEFSVFDQQWIVDPGAAGYADDPLRNYARSTRAHNTLSIGGHEQSQIWGVFRMGRRARVEWARVGSHADGGWSFDGAYRPQFDRRILHQRVVTRGSGGVWRVRDRVTGTEAPVEGALHFHPDVLVEVGPDRLVCRRGDRSIQVVWWGIDGVTLSRGERNPASGWFFPSYGVAQPTATVRYRQRSEGGFDLVPIS